VWNRERIAVKRWSWRSVGGETGSGYSLAIAAGVATVVSFHVVASGLGQPLVIVAAVMV
jgi:hypothetical protein